MKSTDPVAERLLAVARELFTLQGYDGTSVREITTRARANLGAITYHYGSKRGLYHAALDSLVEPLASEVETAARSAGTPLQRVAAIVRAFLEHVTRHPGAPACLLRELAGKRPLPPPLEKVMQRNLGAIAKAIAEGQRDGSIRAGDPRLLVLSVVPHPFYLAVASRLLKGALDMDLHDPATRTRVVDHVVDSICRSLENTGRAAA